jgi:hypothetical protein
MRFLSIIILSFSLFSSLASAHMRKDDVLERGNFSQSIQVVNLLANNVLSDSGMTPTPIIVKYYNGDKQPCWMATLNYQDDYTIHAGPTQGCRAKVTSVEISPTLVADKLKTYQVPVTLSIDTTKYAYQITIIQDHAPTFDSSNGLVEKSGTLQAKIQAQ